MNDLFYQLFTFASTEAPTEQTSGGGWQQLVIMGVMLVGLVLLMILPQKKREKQMNQMLDSIGIGTKVRTIGGIYGTVVNIKGENMTIATGDDGETRLVFVRGAIAAIIEDTAENVTENTENTDDTK